MRLPGTFNQKRGQWCRMVRADRARLAVEPEAIRAALPDPDPPRADSGSGRQGPRAGQPDELAQVAPPAYFQALCALRVSDGGAHEPRRRVEVAAVGRTLARDALLRRARSGDVTADQRCCAPDSSPRVRHSFPATTT